MELLAIALPVLIFTFALGYYMGGRKMSALVDMLFDEIKRLKGD